MEGFIDQVAVLLRDWSWGPRGALELSPRWPPLGEFIIPRTRGVFHVGPPIWP